MSTKEIILERALELFNEKGIEYGGMRELAALLNMRVSNITYYYPTKDLLVVELSKGLAELNGQVYNAYDCRKLADFFEMYLGVFYNQYRYRCLLISFVHGITHNEAMAAGYKQTEKKRRARLEEIFSNLISAGHLKKDADIQLIIGHISIISRFWLSEARISYPDKKIEAVIDHYLMLMCDIIWHHATPKGRKSINDFFKTHSR